MKGVVLLTLNANHLPLCLKVIGANQHESHFLLDIVESNTSDIEITAVSGDIHYPGFRAANDEKLKKVA